MGKKKKSHRNKTWRNKLYSYGSILESHYQCVLWSSTYCLCTFSWLERQEITYCHRALTSIQYSWFLQAYALTHQADTLKCPVFPEEAKSKKRPYREIFETKER